MSSGLVSTRTRMTFSPRPARFSAESASKTAAPEAAPGEAGRPLATTRRPAAGARGGGRALGDAPALGGGVEGWREERVERLRIDPEHRFLPVDQPLLGHVDG